MSKNEDKPYTRQPAPGYDMNDMLKGRGGYFGSELHEVRSGVLLRHPYTITMGQHSELPDQSIMSHKIHHKGEVRMVESTVPEGYLCAGNDPYFQVIQRELGEKRMTRETIQDMLIYTHGYLPDERWARNFINEKIDDMERFGYLASEYEKIDVWFFKVKLVERYQNGFLITTEDRLYEVREGFEIVSDGLMDEIERAGGNGARFAELKEELMNDRRWVRNEDMLWKHLNYLEDIGCIRIEGNRCFYEKPLPPNQIEKEKTGW